MLKGRLGQGRFLGCLLVFLVRVARLPTSSIVAPYSSLGARPTGLI